MPDDQISFFDQERQKYVDDIAKVHMSLSIPRRVPLTRVQSFEQLLDGTNALNRKLEEFTAPSIRNELRSVADLWMAFKNLMQHPGEHPDGDTGDHQRLGQLGLPGTGGYVSGQHEQ
jgi:hypothetical protein